MTRLVVNAQPLEFRVDPQMPLLWALRDVANLTGTKYGCGSGECGACMVLVDGAARPSCQVSLAACEGRSIVTIEGLAAHGFAAIQAAVVEAQAIQCGFCTPGIVMRAAELLARDAGATSATIAATINNICRCGVQPRLAAAIASAGVRLRGAAKPTPDGPRAAITTPSGDQP